MKCIVTICLAILCQVPEALPLPEARLRELVGNWEVIEASALGDQEIVPAEILGLTKKGTVVAIKENELSTDEKRLANLTTDLTNLGFDLDKKVHPGRRPILTTLPSGKGYLCAYDINSDVLTLYYPHTMGRIAAGERLYFRKTRK